MFKAELENSSLLKDSIDSISSLITDATFTISPDGMSLVAMDPASVAMVIFNLLSSSFSEFKVDKEQKITLNVDQFRSILQRASSNDKLILSLDDEKHVLNVSMFGASTRNFNLPLLEDNESSAKVPPLEFSAKIVLDANALKEGVKDASVVSDCVTFETNSEKFVLNAGSETSTSHLEIAKGSPSLFSMEVKETSRAKYSLEYLDKIVKAAKIADKLTIEYSSDYPMKLEFKAIDKVSLSFILAPRVETE